jgi:glyoxylase-like metal-dependent hydrolase (beta-lactamase superfamily II)
MTPVEVAEGVFLLALPLGIHRIPSISAYLFVDPAGDTLIDCGIYAGRSLSTDDVDDGTGALGDALATCGRAFDNLGRLIITHAHIDHYGIAGEVVRLAGMDTEPGH